MTRFLPACAVLLATMTAPQSRTIDQPSVCRAPAGGTVAVARVFEDRDAVKHPKVFTTVACSATKATAEKEALTACSSWELNGQCKIILSFNSGCGYVFRGSSDWKNGSGSGETSQEAYDKCSSLGIDCPPSDAVAGCSGNAVLEPLERVIEAPPVTIYAGGAFALVEKPDGGSRVVASLATGPDKATAEARANDSCVTERRKGGLPGRCKTIEAQSLFCVAIAVGSHGTTGQSRIVSDDNVERALARCNTNGYTCLESNAMQECGRP